MNVIVERQSPDWGSPNFNADEAARLLATRFYGDSEEGLRFAAYTRELHNLWASCFSTPLSSCRKFLKDLAHQNWRQVAKCHAIYPEPQHGVVSNSVFGNDGWLLFTDDDDWFCPNIFLNLEEIAARSSADCVIWNRTRFDGNLEMTPIIPIGDFRLYAYTNNYAVRANTFAAGVDVVNVMQHGYANRMVEEKIWKGFFAHNAALSVTNKSPCTWNYLNKANKSDRPKQTLMQLVEHNAWTPIHVNEELLWMDPYVQATQRFFRNVLSTAQVN